MRNNHKMIIRLITLIVTLLVFIVMISGIAVAADPPKITLAPVWRPAKQLTTIDTAPLGQTNGSDDIRYVDAEIQVTTSVQFWAVEITCTVNKAILETYTVSGDAGSLQDDIPVVRWGPDWGIENYDFTQVPAPYNPATGSIRLTAALLGNRYPLGNNGYATNLLVATVRYRVKSTAGTSPFTCTSSFLNRNGAPVMAATYLAPAPLSVTSGYAINGTLTYQGRTVKSGIGVDCTYDPSGAATPVYSTVTTATGAFSLNALRNYGFYTCRFYGNITNKAPGSQPDLYLTTAAALRLYTPSYTFLPIELKDGNLDRTTPGSEDGIDTSDLSLITANYNLNASGDVNGDNKTDKADLSILASNFDESQDRYPDHMLYSVARNGDVYTNNRIWLGEQTAGVVTQLVPGTSRDFWPTLSPDGSKIAFTREVSGKYALFVTNANGVGTPLRLTPATFTYSSFAASWSPDGTRIAFSCSYDDGEYIDWYFNSADVCVVDATGRNLRNLNPGYGDDDGPIYPPAWLSDTELIFAGGLSSSGTPNLMCQDTLCYYNLLTNETRLFDADIPIGSDMPVIQRQGQRLFYRYSDSGERVLRFADIDNGGVDVYGSTLPVHAQVLQDNTPPDGDNVGLEAPSTDVDYYDVFEDFHIVYYETGGYDFRQIYYNWAVPATPQWTGETNIHWVFDSFGNPYQDTFDPIPSEVFALRNTVDWVR